MDRDNLRAELLEVFERQADAHGLDTSDPAVRGTFRNLLAVILGAWEDDLHRLSTEAAMDAEIDAAGHSGDGGVDS